MINCKYCKDGFCVNADCPEVADFCELDVWCDGTNYFENCEKIYCEYFESEEKNDRA